jgi:hypothetical protein
MNIKKPVNPKVAVAFPDAPKKTVTSPKTPVAFTVPNMPHPRIGGFKSLFRRMRKTTK